MPFVPVPNILQVEMLYSWAGQQIENVTYWWSEGGWDASEALALHAALVQSYSDNVAPVVANTLSLNSVKYTDLSAETGFGVEYATGLPIVGAAGTGSLPNNCAFAIKFVTALRGRSYRGRNFVPGLVEGAVTNNEVNESWAFAWVTFFQEWALAAAALGASQHVVSRFTGNTQRTVGVATEIVSRTWSDVTVDSQRRRLPGRGR